MSWTNLMISTENFVCALKKQQPAISNKNCAQQANRALLTYTMWA